MGDVGLTLRGPSNSVPVLWQVQQPAQTWHSLSRRERYLQYRRYFEGWQWDRQPAAGERQLTVNYARVIVMKTASYLLSEPVSYDFTLADVLPGRTKAAERTALAGVEAYRARVWAANHLDAADLDTAMACGCLGDGAWTVRWSEDLGCPRVTEVDPTLLEARWRGDDRTTLLWVRQTYWLAPVEMTDAQRARLPLAERDPYQPVEVTEEWTKDAWAMAVGGQQIDGGANPYGTIPYIIFPNLRLPGEFWGESDLVDLLPLQRELNGRLSIFSRILEVSGAPTVVVTGADDTSDLKVGPGRLWELPEGATADVLKLLDAGVGQAHFQYIDAIYRALHDVTEMPRTSFGDSSQGTTQARSGVALEIELQPLLHKLARKHAIWEGAFGRRWQLILTVARVHGVRLPAVRATIIWPPVLRQDRGELVRQEVSLVAAGIHAPTTAMGALAVKDPEAELAQVTAEGTALVGAGVAARNKLLAPLAVTHGGEPQTPPGGVG